MPDAYAHARFGKRMLEYIEEPLLTIIKENPNEYEMGLLGPDIFFFHMPYRKNPIAGYGKEKHRQKAADMFSYAIEHAESDASFSYLIGLICHYTLDSRAHPYVNSIGNALQHLRLEAIYDAHLMKKDGIVKPRRNIFKGQLNYGAMAALWQGITPKTMESCIRSRVKYTWLLNQKHLVLSAEAISGKNGIFSCMLLPPEVPPENEPQMRDLDGLFEEALQTAPLIIKHVFQAAKAKEAALCHFAMNYEGIVTNEQA